MAAADGDRPLDLAEVLRAFRLLDQQDLIAIVDRYAEAARAVAETGIAVLYAGRRARRHRIGTRCWKP